MTRPQMEFTLTALVAIAFILWVVKDFYSTLNEAPITKIEMVYDCRLAEISPDYPVVVKDKCRKLMQPKISGVK